MNQDIIVEAVGKHLDAMEAYVNAITILAVTVAWAGVQRSREIKLLGTKFDRRHAFWAVAALYLIANVTILILFLRVGDLVALLAPSHVVEATTALATHSWILNPFSFFGVSSIARLHSSEGFGLLISTWWLCNASLSTLMDDKRNRAAGALLGLFLAFGLATMFAMNRAYAIVLAGLELSSPELHTAVVATSLERSVGNFLGIIVGGLIFMTANKLQLRHLPPTAE